MKKLKLALELALPNDAGACDACSGRILDAVRARPGIADAHIERHPDAPTELCLHYDPAAIRIERLRALVATAGAELARRFEHLAVAVAGLRHERHANLIESILARDRGVLHAAVAFGAGRVYVEFDPALTSRARLLDRLEAADIALLPEVTPVDASLEEHAQHDHAHGGVFGDHSELVFSLGCGLLTGVGWGVSRLRGSPRASIAIFAVAYLLGSWFTIKEVIVALRARRFEIDFLMLLAAIGAAVLGVWFEGALLLFLFTLGHALEGFAMGRARNAIEALSRLAPTTARVIDGDGEHDVPVAQLMVGAQVLVKPNTRVPADGFVEQGTSSVDQAPITGESVPVDKRPVVDSGAALRDPSALAAEHRVFAGTINGSAALTIRVTKRAADSTLARVVKMVAEAETHKSPTQLFTDRFERVFVPVILAGVTLLLFAWVVIDEPTTRSFYRAMAVLVAASPCALAIATPSAVLAGVGRAARGGVLVKGGAHLESLGRVRVMAFDKTGTLTDGTPRLTDVWTVPGVTEDELLRVTLAVEQRSDHPLARAVVTGGAERLGNRAAPMAVGGTEALTGFGIQAWVDGALVRVGKPALFAGGPPLPGVVDAATRDLERRGRSVMVVQRGDQFLGVLGVMDTPRAAAGDVLAALQALGIERTIMLSGDHREVADAIATAVGMKEVRADLLPDQKVAVIAELVRATGGVAMVGDGVNDAPAMARATVGIAMGASGSDVALETADIALMGDDLRALPFAVGLSRAARRIIQQNLWASLGMVALLLPATLFGYAGIGVAVALHEGSTLLVVANALRLLAYRDERVGR